MLRSVSSAPSSTTRCSTRPVLRISTTSTRLGASATSSMWRTVERESVGYCTIATWWVSCESTRTERLTTSSRSTAPSRKLEIARFSAVLIGLTVVSRSTKSR